MSKKPKKSTSIPGFQYIEKVHKITRHKLKSNGLEVLHMRTPGTGVVTSNILYKVGARDEKVGETGLAHMLEHMLFKPTTFDLKRNVDSGAMQFEREIGVILNANTWKDRTTYYFSYPKEHFARALSVEAERMRDLTLTETEFVPERGNVLSEFDMYFGDPFFALELEMRGAALMNHPYGHETIGWREDIENYNVDKLRAFYDQYYWPNNATLMIVGDIDLETALEEVKKQFGHLAAATHEFLRHTVKEPEQFGRREVRVIRETNTNIIGIGFKHAGFPSKEWHLTEVLLQILCAGPESILRKKLVDTGLAADVEYLLEPSSEAGLGLIFITVAEAGTGHDFEQTLQTEIAALTAGYTKARLQKITADALRSEAFRREKSLGMVAEMVEYESAGNLKAMFETKRTLTTIKPQEIVDLAKTMFDPLKLTVGFFGNTK